MVVGLAGGNLGTDPKFFATQVEPLQEKIIEIHKDYIAGFEEIRKHLKDNTRPPSELLDFLKHRRRLYEYEHFMLRDLTLELQKAQATMPTQNLWVALNDYCIAVLAYLSATGRIGGFTWFTQFLKFVQMVIDHGYGYDGEDVWSEVGFSGHPRQELLAVVDGILDQGLPQGFAKVSASYARLKAIA